MAPRSSRKRRSPSPDSNGIFHGMVVFLVPKGVQSARLQVWKRKLAQLGATIVDSLSNTVTHVFAVDSNMLLHQVDNEKLKHFKGSLLKYQWLENCLKFGEKLLEDPYMLKLQEFEGVNKLEDHLGMLHSEPTEDKSSDDGLSISKRTKISSEDRKFIGAENVVANKEMSSLGKLTGSMNQEIGRHAEDEDLDFENEPRRHISFSLGSASVDHSTDAPELSGETGTSKLSLLYKPPDLNRNITEIFGKLINIYRALGDDRRSFSYYKAIPVIEKLPFKIENIDQVKHLPAIGKSLQDHINEIVTTGKLSKLEHFENDEKVRTVTLFGEVWGVGPATALKLYEKGHRTLDDLKNDDSLTSSQRLGVKYFDDIKKKIPRQEVKDMEMLLQKAGHDVLPGVLVVCGGSYRRGKAFCGDLDIIITHPDGESHKGFLPRYVQYLKDIKFLREDLIFSVHSIEGTDSGVDTYFGLCTYPGREQRHRIDLKVYPRNIYAFGLIAWTGNDVLNRRLRLLADSKGYRLDDTGLFLATQSSSGKRGAKSSISVSCTTEKEVFDMLGFPYLEPHERNL